MPVRPRNVHRLQTWTKLKNQSWPTLIVGNGLSINIWPEFAYPQLLPRAAMSAAASQLFIDLRTSNFEVVLEALWHAERVLGALGRPHKQVIDLYAHIRSELIDAIGRVHVAWSDVDAATFTQIADALDDHALAFTLNYDLLTYWALMENRTTTNIGDFFWNQSHTFDPADTGLSSNRTGLLYLHGGVHLWQNASTGETGKWTAQSGNLLTGLAGSLRKSQSRQPLLVSEGTSRHKMRVVRRSDYLSFAHHQLIADTANTVIFGVSFGSQDDHIVRAINTGGRRRLAISVYPGSPDENIAAMAHYETKFPGMDLNFFDSRTHPLGDSGLRVP